MSDYRQQYDPLKDAAKSYDEAVAALRARLEAGEPVQVFGQKVVPALTMPDDVERFG